MINAVLYSDQVIPANERIDRFLLEMLEGRGNRIGYVPSGPDPDGRFWPADLLRAPWPSAAHRL
jgi:dipeptidase E